MNATIVSNRLDEATPIPQLPEAPSTCEPLLVMVKGKRAFYISFEGPYVRFSSDQKLDHINEDVCICN